jgi:regulator of protease activity HflC (stomatin/prohibitin superfamily)
MSNGLQTSLQQKKQSEIGIQTAQNQRNQTIINADAQRQQAILTAQGVAQSQVIQANATKQSILTVLQSVGCGDDKTCQQQAGDLYLQLLNYKQICAGTTNCLFFIGQGNNGQPVILQLPAKP